MSRLEYVLASVLLRVLGAIFDRLPIEDDRVVLASPRSERLEGNLRSIHEAILARHAELRPVALLEPYGYGLRQKLGYLAHVVRGMYCLCTARLFVVDNAYLPVHVRPHRRGTTVVQVWHAVSAVKRFGVDTNPPPDEPERTFLHRNYDYVIASSEGTRATYATALRTPLERVLALGSPRTDLFFDPRALEAARQRILHQHPALADRRVVVYAPTFRGRGRGKRSGAGLDAIALRAALPARYAIVFKGHPNLDVDPPLEGFDVVVDRRTELNDLLVVTDILVSDYSAAIFEFALLRRPFVLLAGDLAEYEREPGMYVDYRAGVMVPVVTDTAGVAEAILADRFDLSGYDALVERHAGACDGRSTQRFVERFLG